MRQRVLIVVSLIANVLLAAGWLVSSRTSLRASRAALGAEQPDIQVKTNVVIRRQFFSWQQVESDDYRTYVANLRDIGCPEQTIRDIIIADVNALYAKKRATEVVSPAQQWWRSVPDSNVVQVATAKIRELEEERRALLTSLLGLGWESGDLVSLPRPSRSAFTLDGPVLGVLPDEVKKTVQQIISRFQDQVQDWREAQKGGASDLASLFQLNRQLRKDLAQVLSPPQLEEFLLRYSTTATALRTKLNQVKYFNATPDEFRALFRASDGINQQLQALSGATDEASVRQRTALEQQREDAIRLALGRDRYAQYRLLQEQAYQEAVAAAQQADSPASTPVLYELNRATADELARIRSNTNLTERQRAIELKKVDLEQLKAEATALGEELPPEPVTATPKTQEGISHVLAPSETLGSIAIRYGISPILLQKANPNLDLNKLKAGDVLNIPLTFQPSPPPRY